MGEVIQFRRREEPVRHLLDTLRYWTDRLDELNALSGAEWREADHFRKAIRTAIKSGTASREWTEALVEREHRAKMRGASFIRPRIDLQETIDAAETALAPALSRLPKAEAYRIYASTFPRLSRQRAAMNVKRLLRNAGLQVAPARGVAL